MAKNPHDASASPLAAGVRRPLTRLAGLGVAGALALLAGCSTLFEPVNQEVALRTLVDDQRVEALCELHNDKGRWTVSAPANIAITRSSGPLTVECHGSDGLVATQTFEANGRGESIAGSNVSSGYPYRLELALAQPDPALQSQTSPAAAAVDPGQLPHVNDLGRAAYARFLAGDLPRAFAISDNGQWIRVNGARSAGRLAMDRCLTLGGNCGLYAVDNAVVWEDRNAARLAANR